MIEAAVKHKNNTWDVPARQKRQMERKKIVRVNLPNDAKINEQPMYRKIR